MANIPWYRKYDELKGEVQALKEEFNDKCTLLGICPYTASNELRKDIIARIVHESNWQEDLYLSKGRTKELNDEIFEVQGLEGPHLDFNAILDGHRRRVVRFKRNKITVEELASYNLSFAHVVLDWIANELSSRQAMTLVHALQAFEGIYKENKEKISHESIDKGFEIIKGLKNSQRGVYAPLTNNIATEGELVNELGKIDFNELLHPMKEEYLHLMHNVTLMGIMSSAKRGSFRKIPVHVGNPDIFFPPPSALSELMKKYCHEFPTIMPATVKYDAIRKAAEASYRFVRIHPYVDGNGRLSRLLMNLVLWGHYPPTYLKANKKGRHRYAQAIKRADRGNIEPLSSLIAISLKEIYQKLIDSLAL